VVVELKLRKEYLNVVTFNTPVSLQMKNSKQFDNGTLFNVNNIKTVRFLDHRVYSIKLRASNSMVQLLTGVIRHV